MIVTAASGLWSASAAIAATAATIVSGYAFAQLDCQPSLYLYDKLCVNKESKSAFWDHKCVWIIGASSGMGAELAKQVAASVTKNTSCTLILSSRSATWEQERNMKAVVDTCRAVSSPTSANFRIHVLPMDVVQDTVDVLEEKVKTLTELTKDQPIDLVVLNAGAGHMSPAIETSAATVQQVVQANAVWPMILTPLLFRHDVFGMNKPSGRNCNGESSSARLDPNARQNKRIAHLVVTSSVAAKFAVPLSAAYAASKHALSGYFASFVSEGGPTAMSIVSSGNNGDSSSPYQQCVLRVDMMCPGPVDTPFHQNHVGKTKTGEENRASAGLKHSSSSPSRLKMPVKRCVELMISAMMMKEGSGGLREYWIASQPTLTALYANHLFPGLMQSLLQKVGRRRVEMWKQGLDLYDPASWMKAQRATPLASNASREQSEKNKETDNEN